ncbi:MAG: peptidase [Candidatus Competibacteraceae bacterium]|nr:peptidase [Candidatus Competibacteraceae bacterium]
MSIRRTVGASVLFSAAVLCASVARADVAAKDVLENYANMAHAMYSDALSTAQDLQRAVVALIETPSEDTLAQARTAWKAARVPYQQTEGYRFGNAIVDDWEGRVNAWPLDEGLIDYVDTSSYGDESDDNPLYGANVIANPELQIGSERIDAREINKALLADSLHEAQSVEANVATGYHAIEFLLWGQDLNGTGPGAGQRPATDFDTANCSGGHCERRAQYLQAATDLLVDDLQEMVTAWAPDGAARQALDALDPQQGLGVILTGLGSLSYGELAGERIKLGLILHDPEEEHDCFSDNTHNSHYYDQVGMLSIYSGTYQRVDGSTLEGPGLADYAQSRAPEANAKVLAEMDATLAAMQVMKDTADSGKMAYDQMIGENNPEGNKIVENVVLQLVAQTRALETLVGALDLSIQIEGSDSLDSPATVQ